MADRFAEFRLYKLKPGMRDAFHAIAKEAVEMLARHRIMVVGHGPSAHIESYNTIVLEPSDPAIRTIAKLAG